MKDEEKKGAKVINFEKPDYKVSEYIGVCNIVCGSFQVSNFKSIFSP